MLVEDSCRRDVTNRMRRVQGQIAGIVAMLDDGRDCSDIVTQVAAASKALDRAGLRLVADGLQQCAAAAERGEAPPMDPAQLERLFLALS
jgi:DNA-binding FrmR family transcriptional regulator